MSRNMEDNKKQLPYENEVSQGKRISTDLTRNCEVVCLISKCEVKRRNVIEYREEEIPDCGCIYG